MSKTFGIDLGTSNLKIYKKGKGVILKEKNIIAIDKKKGPIAIGDEAYEMLDKTPKNIEVSYPVKSGVIADFENMLTLLNSFLRKANCANSLFNKSEVFISVPYDITDVEKRAIYDLVENTSIKTRKIHTIDKPIAGAIGAGLEVADPCGIMMVDIGSDTTEISILSLGGVVISKLIQTGGNQFDMSIINFVKKNYNLLIGGKTAENLKINLASALPNYEKSLKVVGRNIVTGLPAEIEISSDMVYEAIVEYLNTIIDAIKYILERTPPELSSDIISSGIYLIGGGAAIHGLEELINKETGLIANILDEPEDCVIKGLGIIVEESKLYRSISSSAKGHSYKY